MSRIGLVVLATLICSAAFFPGLPISSMDGDTANINSFAAALDSPETFRHDALLADSAHFRWYTPAFVGFVRVCAWLGLHYDTSRAFLAALSVALALPGYFWLFHTLSRSVWLAMAATWGLLFMTQYYPPEEMWSATYVMPRTVCAACLPWVLWLMCRLLRKPRLWSIPSGAAAMLLYVHPVTAPAVTGGVLTGLLLGSTGYWRHRWGYAILAGAVAVAVMVPYACLYTAKYAQTVHPDPEIMAQAYQAAIARIKPLFLDPALLYPKLAEFFLGHACYWPGAVALLWLIAARRHRRSVRVFLAVGLGFSTVTFVIPSVDAPFARWLGRLPFQLDLLRNFRYVDAFSLCVLAVAARELSRTRYGRARTLSFGVSRPAFSLQCRMRLVMPLLLVAATIIVAYAPSAYEGTSSVLRLARRNLATLRGYFPAEVADQLETLYVLQATRKSHERVAGSHQWRQANIPVALTHKDLGALIYSDPIGLVAGTKLLADVRPKLASPVTLSKARAALAALEADFLVLNAHDAAPDLADCRALLLRNRTHLVLRAAALSTRNQTTTENLDGVR